MREAWAQICDGVSLVAGAAAALLRGPEPLTVAGTTGAVPPETPATPPSHDPLHALVRELVQRFTESPASSAMAVSTPPATPATPDGSDVALRPPAGPPCEERERQAADPQRYATLAQDPLDAMDKAAYYCCRLEANPTRAEDVTRSIEALPGTAQHRLAETFAQGGIPGWQTYAAYYDEIQRSLRKCLQFAESPAAQTLNDDDALLDADRYGRILFWLGDRPDVEVLTAPTPVEAPDAEAAPVNIIPLRATVAPEEGPFDDDEAAHVALESVAGAPE